MKKYISIFIMFILFSVPFYVLAEDPVIGISNGNTIIRSCAAANEELCPSLKEEDGTNALVYNNQEFTILDTVDSINPEQDGCSSKQWYKLSYNEQDGYVCTALITIKSNEPEPPTPPAIPGDFIGAKYKVVSYATHNTEGRVSIVELKEGMTSDFNCDKVKVLINNKLHCVASNTLSNISSVDVLNTNNISYDFETELNKFPESYRSYLRNIHNMHPNWRFYAYDTGLEWRQVVDTEKNDALIDSYATNPTYFDVAEGVNYNWRTNTWRYYEANRWVRPSKVATAYYLDPRTYLEINTNLSGGVTDYRNIFVFEDARAYTYQMDSSIDQMLIYGGINRTFESNIGTVSYKQAFTDGANFSKISPLILIARSRGETAKFTSNSVSGNYTNPDTGVSYAGYYNYFNVGAYGAYPVTNGLIYAQNAGWNDRYKAIVEGSIFIGTKYIYNGQETQYFQKFNVSPYTLSSVYGHEYQTNIEAPITEAGWVFWGYKDSNNIDKPIVFHIPVYKNMPEEASVKPRDGHPNNWLTDLKIDGVSISNFDGDNYYAYDNNWDNKDDDVFTTNVYNYTVEWNKPTINIDAIKAYSGARVEGAGEITVSESKIVDVKVIAENGTTKTYRLNLTKQEAPELDEEGNPIYPLIKDVLDSVAIKYNNNYISGLKLGTTYKSFEDTISKVHSLVKVNVVKNSLNKNNYFATGDVIKITSGTEVKELTYVLYGDLNGDGIINLSDLINSRNIVLGISNLSGPNKEAGDINRNGKVELSDLIDIRNNILGIRDSLQ